MTLRGERPVVEKEAVPVERVKLARDTTTDEVEVAEDVRQEKIVADGVDDTTQR